jgi:hypothetical protein
MSRKIVEKCKCPNFLKKTVQSCLLFPQLLNRIFEHIIPNIYRTHRHQEGKWRVMLCSLTYFLRLKVLWFVLVM